MFIEFSVSRTNCLTGRGRFSGFGTRERPVITRGEKSRFESQTKSDISLQGRLTTSHVRHARSPKHLWLISISLRLAWTTPLPASRINRSFVLGPKSVPEYCFFVPSGESHRRVSQIVTA